MNKLNREDAETTSRESEGSVLMKPSNAGGGKDPGWKRTLWGDVMGTSEPSNKTDTRLQRIGWLSATDASKQFECLRHLFNEESLTACFHALDGKKAVGVDGVTKAEYGAELENNVQHLVARMKRMGYRPGPVRRVLIPKDGNPGALRPLGISNVEDKLVQAMMHRILEAIYEPVFRRCAYGFRSGRGAHDAVRALH